MAPQLIGKDVTKQTEIDNFMLELDGTENKSKLGMFSLSAHSFIN
jgi:enolase